MRIGSTGILRRRCAFLMMSIATTLAACGGGDGQSGAPLPPDRVPPPGGPVVVSTPPPPPAPLPEDAGPANKRVGACPSEVQCAGTEFTSLTSLAASLRPGDVVDIYPRAGGAPHDGVRFTAKGAPDAPIVVRGVAVDGVRPVILGGSQSSTGYAAVYFDNTRHMLLQNVVVTNGKRRRNGDTIDGQGYAPQFKSCVKNEAHEVTLRDVLITDCPNNGVLGTDRNSGSLTLERVVIMGSGCDPSPGAGMTCGDVSHPVYVATDAKAFPEARLRIIDSVIQDNNAGVAIKSRARRLEVYHSWIRVANSRETRAVDIYGFDGSDGEAPDQASLAHPIHADLVGNVFLVDASSTRANAVIRAGSDFDPDENNANTYGRVRLVHNTFVVAGSLGQATSKTTWPLVRMYGKLEGLMAINNHAVVADNRNGSVLLVGEDDTNPVGWVAPDGKPRMFLSHNSLPTGSFAWRSGHSDTSTPMSAAAPEGFFWSDWVSAERVLGSSTYSIREIARNHLVPPRTSKLANAGTVSTNPQKHPLDSSRAFAIPDALAFPARHPAALQAGVLAIGDGRGDATSPTIGAMQAAP
jgi:hypothetical protein